MSQYQRPQPGQYQRQPPPYEAPPSDPASQPHPPGDTCQDLPPTTPPTLDPPTPCPDPDPPCHCPSPPPGSGPSCLEDLIAVQTAQIATADKAKTFKAALEDLLSKAKTASQQYNRGKYETLVKEWVKQDGEIAELIRKLVCAVPCWRCIIECYVCPILNEMHYAEQWLYRNGTSQQVHNLYDLLHWHTRDKEAKERRFNRIKKVLEAWETPAQTIEKNLFTGNRKLIGDAGNLVGSPEAGKAVYDVFLKLVPMHLAIAPPSGSAWTTKISKEYTQFCACDTGTPDDCCGPDVGEWSLRQRLIGPQPYLVDPNEYFPLICCLVEKRYGPAKDALTKAETSIVMVQNQINSFKALIDDRFKPSAFDTEAKGAIPGTIDCCDYEHDDKPAQTR
jgi:hypothetical protein